MRATYASNNRDTFVTEWRGEFTGFAFDLLSQFASRCQDKRIRPKVAVVVRQGREIVYVNEHRKHEGGRFTRACRGSRYVSRSFTKVQTSEPVSAIPIRSRFCKPIGMACRWMGDGSLYPAFSITSKTVGGSGDSSQDRRGKGIWPPEQLC